MSSSLINTSNEGAHPEWSLGGVASFGLRFLRDFVHHSLHWVLALMSVPVVQSLVSHELAQESGVGGQA